MGHTTIALHGRKGIPVLSKETPESQKQILSVELCTRMQVQCAKGSNVGTSAAQVSEQTSGNWVFDFGSAIYHNADKKSTMGGSCRIVHAGVVVLVSGSAIQDRPA